MFFSAGYNAVKYYIYTQLNEQLQDRITFSDVSLSVIPPRITVKNLKNYRIKDDNVVSFDSVTLTMPIPSLFSDLRGASLIVEHPKILVDPTLFEKSARKPSLKMPSSKFEAVEIRNGELLMRLRKLLVFMVDFNVEAVKLGNETLFRLAAQHLKIEFPMTSKQKATVAGNLEASFRQEAEAIKITKFQWNTEDFRVNAHGRIFNDGTLEINAFLRGNAANILEPLLDELTIDGPIAGNAVIRRGSDSIIRITGRYSADNFRTGGQAFSDLQGRVSWNSENKRLVVNNYFRDHGHSSQLLVENQPPDTQIQMRNVSARKVARMIDIYEDVPLGGTVVRGTIGLKQRMITGLVQLQSRPADDDSFQIGGIVGFGYDLEKRHISFQGEDLKTDFGSMTLNGRIHPREDLLDIRVNARVSSSQHIHPYAIYFADLDLSPWQLSQGSGNVTLQVDQKPGADRFAARFTLTDLMSHGQPIQSLAGEIEGLDDEIYGAFDCEDPDLEGQARLVKDTQGVKITFEPVSGAAQKILEILQLDIPLQGRMTGRFSYHEATDSPTPRVEGNLVLSQATFLDMRFDSASCTLSSNLEDIRLNDLRFSSYEGEGSANIAIDFAHRRFDLSGRLSAFNLKRIHADFSGRGEVEFAGKGAFNTAPIRVRYTLKDFAYYSDRRMDISGQANITTDFSDFDLKLVGFIQLDNGTSPFNINLTRSGGQHTGFFKLHLKDINQIIPWRNSAGKLVIDARIVTDEEGRIQTRGIAQLNGKVLAFPNFPHALRDFQGFLTFRDLNFTLSSLTGTLGGGPVESSGFLIMDDGGIGQMRINIQGERNNLFLIDRTTAEVNADLTLTYEDESLLLSGTLVFLSALWEREIDEDIVFITAGDSSGTESKITDLLRLDLHLTGRDNIRMVNSFGNLSGRFDLHVTGGLDFPGLTGTIEGEEGQVFFSDTNFNLVKAKLIFNDRFQINPQIDIQSETFIKNYRIHFSISGTADKLKPEFRSSPPLPPQDVLALISLGELFKRPASTELSSQIGSTGLITDKLTEDIEKRVKKIFGIDLFRLDPMITGTSVGGESRLSIGKSISKNLLIVYSTTMSSSRQEILYLLYQLSPSISIIGMRNEEGKFSIDIRFRQRR